MHLARVAGLQERDSEALLNGEQLDDARLEGFRQFTLEMLEERGKVSEEVWERFLKAGCSRQNALEIVFAIAMKTMSNYTNALAGVPLDDEVNNEL